MDAQHPAVVELSQWLALGRTCAGLGKQIEASMDACRAFTETPMDEPWEQIPESLRHGIIRLAAHRHRTGEMGDYPPAAVCALWRPWHRIRGLV